MTTDSLTPKVVWIGRLRWRYRLGNLIHLLGMGLRGYAPSVQWPENEGPTGDAGGGGPW